MALCTVRALSMSACGLTLDDEAVRVVLDLRLGIHLINFHVACCQCFPQPFLQVGLWSNGKPSEPQRHQTSPIEHLSPPTLSKEPVGLLRSDGKRPDGLTLISWQLASRHIVYMGRRSQPSTCRFLPFFICTNSCWCCRAGGAQERKPVAHRDVKIQPVSSNLLIIMCKARHL